MDPTELFRPGRAAVLRAHPRRGHMTTSRGSSRAEVIELAAQLVRTDSVNPALVPGAAGETEIVDLLSTRLTRSGFTVQIVPAGTNGDRPSLLATLPGTGSGRSLLLNGHLDTVGTSGVAQPFAGQIDGDHMDARLLGRGACDMKGAVAAMVIAAEAVASDRLAGDVTLALVADEEHGSLGTEAILARLEAPLPDACLIGEPTSLDLVVAHRGYVVFEVTLTGHTAHSSEPTRGVNAVTHLGRLLGAIETRHTELRTGSSHPLMGTGTLIATVVHGGTAPFMLAGNATAVVERRTLPGETLRDATIDMDRILADLRRDDPTVRATASVALAREPWVYDADAPAATALTEAMSSAVERHWRPPARTASPFWLEAPLYETAGIPAVVCGPAGGGAHANNEWLDIGQLLAYTRALTETIHDFCGNPTKTNEPP